MRNPYFWLAFTWAAVFAATWSMSGCANAPVSPIISPGTVTLVEQIALDFAQGALNGAETSGKVTPAEYSAAEAILVQLDTDLTNGQGTLTQAQVDQLINTALASVAAIYAPAIQPLPVPVPPATVARAAWHAKPLAKK